MISQTILTVVVIWLVLLPKCELERTASINPLPRTFLLLVSASNPEEWDASVCPHTHDVVVGRIRGDWREVSSLLLAEFFSVPPTLLLSAPEVTLASILLPVFFASLNTLALVTSWAWDTKLWYWDQILDILTLSHFKQQQDKEQKNYLEATCLHHNAFIISGETLGQVTYLQHNWSSLSMTQSFSKETFGSHRTAEKARNQSAT